MVIYFVISAAFMTLAGKKQVQVSEYISGLLQSVMENNQMILFFNICIFELQKHQNSHWGT